MKLVGDPCLFLNIVVVRLGDVEPLRKAMPGNGLVLEAGKIYWLTDRFHIKGIQLLYDSTDIRSHIAHLQNPQISRTPHESLALKQSSFRQFFRLVTSQVSLWYSNHSTPNPLGVVPEPGVTRVVTGDKFSEEGVELVEEIDDLKKKKHKKHKHKHLQKQT